MIVWQNPAAFVGLLALAGPILIHLLRRRQAARISFPTIRFIDPAATGAVRLRLPSDRWLLLLRLAVLGLAVCALARPVLPTPARINTWDARVVRAVVIDVSDSMRPSAAAAREAAEAEARGAHEAIRIEAADLGDGLRRAAARLQRAQPGRREAIVVSDFQEGALDAASVRAVPDDVGLRFHRVGGSAAVRTLAGVPLLEREQHITLDGHRTVVEVGSAAALMGGLEILTGPMPAAAAAQLARAVALSGAPAPSPDQPIVFISGELDRAAVGRRFEPARITAPWMVRTVLRLRHDAELSAAARTVEDAFAGPTNEPWIGIALGKTGQVVARAAADGDALAIHVAAVPDSYLAAAALRALLWARRGDVVQQFAEREVLTIPGATLAGWTRNASPVAAGMWRHVPDTDARWFWLAVLGLLVLETWMRRRSRATVPEEAVRDSEARVA